MRRRRKFFLQNCPVKAKIAPAKGFLLRFFEFSSKCRTGGQTSDCQPNVGHMASMLELLAGGYHQDYKKNKIMTRVLSSHANWPPEKISACKRGFKKILRVVCHNLILYVTLIPPTTKTNDMGAN